MALTRRPGKLCGRPLSTSRAAPTGNRPLYVAFAPLAFLRPGSRKLVIALGGYAAYLFLTWWLLTHRLDRFWLPILPCLAILAGVGADWTKDSAWGILRALILAFALVCNLIDCSTAL